MATSETTMESAIEKRRARQRARYAADPQKNIAKNRLYRRRTRERVNELQRLRSAAGGEKERERDRACQKAHPEKNRANQARRRAKGRGTWTKADISRLMELQKHKCAHTFCRTSLKGGYHIDHIMPLALGGSNAPSNLQLLCVPCNLSKASRHPVDFAQMRGLLL